MFSRELLKKAESGEADAMYELAMAYGNGEGIEANFDKCLEWLDKAAELNHPEALFGKGDYWMSVAQSDNSDGEDWERAFYWMQEAANYGHIVACYNLGVFHRDGIGTPMNKEQAFYWFQKAAQGGDTQAKHDLALCYSNGRGIAQNYSQAFYWAEQAANEGHIEAKTSLGYWYCNGLGVPADVEKGMSLWREAAAQGSKTAAENLKDAERGLKNISNSGNSNSQKSGCYIATCVYGSYDCPEVWMLRRFRDNTLKHSWFGRLFIKIYYAVSPQTVKFFGNKKWFNKLCKPILNKLVCKLHNNGVDKNPYSDT